MMDKAYSPQGIEEKWYAFWRKNELFNAADQSDLPAFSIVIPPPNVTGVLHMGHALNNTLQDILIRWKRMSGYNTLWMPGMDHAGIATQNVVESEIGREGLTRHDLGRDKFVERVWKWKERSGGQIFNQLEKLGCSCDWDRQRFTLDQGLSEAVTEVFIRLHGEGLIYRGDYIINWCPRCHTALSDLEVEHEDTKGSLYHLKYPFKDGSGFVTVATTRPETMLGDTAVAVHPDDERYSLLVGKTLVLPVINREIPVIADKYVDKQFGSGAVKVTPAHDPNDFEIGARHNLPSVVVMNEDGSMSKEAGPYAGQDRYECRKNLLNDLEAEGTLIKTLDHRMSVGHCYRCKTVIEPRRSKQWFVKMKPLAEPAIEAVRSGKIKIIPQGWENSYFDWMLNIRDWCISRQIWWGHRIPAWHCDCGEIIVARQAPKLCNACGGTKLHRDEDVLDTWFSSALWPFSTLGWPEKTPALETFYPTSTLITGFDILFFWVARMIMMGMKFMGDIPFKDVYIHALVRDAHGQKMSKSKGNVVNPLTMIEKFGTDAFRFTLTAFAAQGRDVKFSEDRAGGYRNFVNKVWNASRFILMNIEEHKASGGTFKDKNISKNISGFELNLIDRWILSRLNTAIGEVDNALRDYRFNDAAAAVYQFIWREFCDWYIELSKSVLQEKCGDAEATRATLLYVLETSLRLLHPFMPFVTEEIWQSLPNNEPTNNNSQAGVRSIMIAPFPVSSMRRKDSYAEKRMTLVMDAVSAVRTIRGEMNIPPSKRLKALISAEEQDATVLEAARIFIETLARCDIEIGTDIKKPDNAATEVKPNIEVYVPLEGLVDIAAEVARLEKDLKKIETELATINKKLNNEDFLERAPKAVIEKEQAKLKEASNRRAKVKESIKKIRACAKTT